MSTACASTARTSRPRLGGWAHALATTLSIHPSRPHAEARRTRALTRRSLCYEAKTPRVCIGYKSPPLRLSCENTAVRRPPLPSLPRARASASFHCRPTIPTSSLDPSEASMAVHWPPPPRALLESKRLRACHRGLVAAAHRRLPRPRQHHRMGWAQSSTCATCCPAPAPPRHRRTYPPPQGYGCEVQGPICKPGTRLQWKLS
jgi:hypothetical protein